MDLYEAIKGRRSIRGFKPDPVPKEVLERIFEMAIWALSGMNLQNWYFVVVTGDRKKALLVLPVRPVRPTVRLISLNCHEI